MDEKRALTLCGGGAKGAYEIGAVRALYELGEKFDIITGTSIGALTGAMLVQGDAEQLNRLWEGLSIRSVMTEGFAGRWRRCSATRATSSPSSKAM